MQRPIPKWLAPVLALLALAGFADAGYLTAEHYLNAIPPCTLHGCEKVLTSAYSTVFGVPIALLGAVYYLFFLVLLLIHFLEKKDKPLYFLMHVSVVGFLADLWFVSAQAFIIHAWCQYCLLSATASTLIFLVSAWYLISSRMKAKTEAHGTPSNM